VGLASVSHRAGPGLGCGLCLRWRAPIHLDYRTRMRDRYTLSRRNDNVLVSLNVDLLLFPWVALINLRQAP